MLGCSEFGFNWWSAYWLMWLVVGFSFLHEGLNFCFNLVLVFFVEAALLFGAEVLM